MMKRLIGTGHMLCDGENPIPFSSLPILADTPSRKAALKASGWFEAPKSNRPRQPLVQFDYPKRDSFQRTTRSVRLIKADDRYFVGLEILPDNAFQFKKFLKTKATNIKVLEF